MSEPVAAPVPAPAETAAPTSGLDGSRVPGTLDQAFRLSRYQFRDYLRSRRFVLMIGIVVAIGAILSLVLYHFHGAGLSGSADAFYGSLWAGAAPYVIVFAGIIFGGDAIAGEFQNKTGYFLMGLPIRRTSVYLGKYVAAFLASTISLLLFLAIVVGNGVVYLGVGSVNGALLVSLGIALLYLAALLGAVFLFSSMFKNSLYAVLVVAVLFLFGFTIIQDVVVGLVHMEPWFLISYANIVISYPFGAIPPHIQQSAFTGTTYSPYYWEGIVIMLGYAVLTALGGLAFFEREEFT
jgi:ABC-2 type transport system permease protein